MNGYSETPLRSIRRKMIYRLLADSVLVFHLGFVVFVLVGGLLVARRPAAAWLHLPAAGWGVLVQFGGWICPLTPLENHLRMLGGQAGYSGGFVEYYLLSVLYPDGLTRGIQLVLSLCVLTINLGVYGYLLCRGGQRWRASRTAA
jgi:hypothetical protein